MEKYEALFRTINDKIAECEKTIEYYRHEMLKAEKIILDQKEKLEKAEADYCEAQKQAFDYAEENKALKAANEALRTENHKLAKF